MQKFKRPAPPRAGLHSNPVLELLMNLVQAAQALQLVQYPQVYMQGLEMESDLE